MIPTTVEDPNPGAEWLRLSDRYRKMSDDDLVVLARQESELSDVARQALASEISQRRLKVLPEEAATPPSPPPESGATYEEERELVEICTVWSLPDALQVQTLLDRAGIPFFMGPEKATGVDEVTSSFVNGVSTQVMSIGVPWANQALKNYFPENEPPTAPEKEEADIAVRCPKCQSTEIVFERIGDGPLNATNPPSKFDWTCDDCGHRWEDEGFSKEE
jgi:DNA-directed RNA polymerase subunit M/transcription elongation factor TFIIS